MARFRERPRVLVVIKGLGLGGAEQLIASGSRFWDRTAFDYRVAYLLPWKDHFVADLEENEVPVVCVGGRRGFTPGSLWRLRREVARSDLVHAHLPMTGILVRLLARSVPVVYTEHNLTHSYNQITRRVNRVTYRFNQASVAVSDGVAATLEGYPGPPITIIPNGVALGARSDGRERVRTELGLSPHQPLIVQVANIRPGKGHDHLVDVAARVVAVRSDAFFVSIGSEKLSGDLERLRERAREAGLEQNLLFLGPRTDALDFTAAADLFVNPSQVDGLPIALLEALALERPVAATAVGGVPGVIESGHNGILVRSGDAQGMASAILDLLASPVDAGALASVGRATVEERYGADRMVSSYEALYRSVLSRGQSPGAGE